MIKGDKLYKLGSGFMLAVCFVFCYIGTEKLSFGKSIIMSLISGTVLSAVFLFLPGKDWKMASWGVFAGTMGSFGLLITDAVLKTVTEMRYGFSFAFNINVYRAIPLLLMFSMAFIVIILARAFERSNDNNDFVSGFRVLSIAVLALTVVFYAVCFGIGRAGNNETSVNLIPFKTIGEYLSWYRSGNWIEPMIQFFGNIMFFFVFGFYGQICFPKIKKVFLCIFPIVLSGGIELSQLILKNGNCDIDDLILNVFGFFLGWGVMIGVEILSSLIKNSNEFFLTFNKKEV